MIRVSLYVHVSNTWHLFTRAIKKISVFQYYIISRLIVKICVSKCGNTTPHNAEKRVSRKGCLTLPSDCDFASCFFHIGQHTFSNTVQFSILCLLRMESKVSLLFIHFHKLRILKKRHGNPAFWFGFPWRFSLTRIVFG